MLEGGSVGANFMDASLVLKKKLGEEKLQLTADVVNRLLLAWRRSHPFTSNNYSLDDGVQGLSDAADGYQNRYCKFINIGFSWISHVLRGAKAGLAPIQRRNPGVCR